MAAAARSMPEEEVSDGGETVCMITRLISVPNSACAMGRRKNQTWVYA